MKAAAFAVRAAARREFADLPDADLLRRFAAEKDDDAFAELVRRYGPLVWRVARTTAGPLADDVFQATFLILSKQAAGVRTPTALAGWLQRTAYRAAVRARKAEAKRFLPRPPAEPGASADPLDRLTARELLAAVDEELAALPDALRAAVVLCGVEGLSQDEAAKRLGWTPGSVKGRLERGRAKLLARLDARGLALPAVLGGLVAVPAELTAATLAVGRGGAVVPAVAKLVAEVPGMNWSSLVKPAAALLALVAGLAVTATGGATPGPAARPQAVNPKPPAKADPAPPPLLRWSFPLRTDLDDPSTDTATTGVWTPDGKHVLVAGSARPRKGEDRVGEVRVHDAATGKVVHTYRGAATTYDNRAGHLAVSPDGKRVASGGRQNKPEKPWDQILEIWDWGADKPRAKVAAPAGVWGAKFSRDSKTLYVATGAGELFAWNAADGTPVWKAATIDTDGKAVSMFAVSLHPTRPILATSGNDGRISFWDAATGKPRGEFRPGTFALSVVFAPDGGSIAIGGGGDGGDREHAARYPLAFAGDGTVTVAGPRVEYRPTPPDDVIYQVAFSSDGKLLAAACQDKTVRVYDAATGKPLALATEHKDFVYSVQFSPDGKSLLSVGRDSVMMWSVAELMKRVPKAADLREQKEAAAKRDLARFKGEWELRSIKVDGEDRSIKTWPKAAIPGLSGLEEEEILDKQTGKPVRVIDATASPKTIDNTVTAEPEKGQLVKGIYEFVSWDVYRVCWGLPGGERPTRFESKPGSGHVLVVMARVLPKKD